MARAKVLDNPLEDVNFRCFDCGNKWSGKPDRIDDAPDLIWHPHKYFATCRNCGALDIPQVAWERNMLKAWANITGPKTPEGRAAQARAGVENFKNGLTPEVRERSKFNGMKHGLTSKVAMFFPAKPGKYPHCASCEHLNKGCNEEDGVLDRPPACLKRTELFMRHHVAFERGDPKMLMGLHADTQASVRALIDDMILAIVQEGVSIKSPKYVYDQGKHKFSFVEYEDDQGNQHRVFDIEAHPLLRTLGDYLAKNSMSLTDLEMTPKSRDEAQTMRGFLETEDESRESTREFQDRTQQGLDTLRRLIQKGHEPIQIEDAVIVEESSDG